MRTSQRLVAVLATSTAAVALVSCGTPSAIEQQADYVRAADQALPDCNGDSCAAQVTTLTKTIAALPGVLKVGTLDYNGARVDREPTIAGAIEVTPAMARDDCDALKEAASRVLWQSAISPITGLLLSCYESGATGNDYRTVSVRLDAFTLDTLKSWGPRAQS